MNNQSTDQPMVEFPLTHPPTRLFAYVNSHPNNQVMGVVMDGRTGKIIETLILPTKQRVMLGLGIANDNAHAHHMYRRLYPHGYRLIWTDNPKEDIRLSKLKERLEEGAGELRRDDNASEAEAASSQRKTNHEVGPALPLTGQLTAELVRDGVEKAKTEGTSQTRPDNTGATKDGRRTIVPEQPDASNTDAERGDTPPVKPDFGGFF